MGPRDPNFEAQFVAELDLPAPLAVVLRQRGLTTLASIQAFIKPPTRSLHDPFTLPDMAPAVERLQQALQTHEPILVHGDYDADGITSAALLVRVLSKLGADVHYYIPHRFHDHYGLSTRAVKLGGAKNVGLVIAVDCGVSDHESIAEARALGMDVIVVDHHEPGEYLPAGALVVNPKRQDSQYPFRELTAVGLAYKVSCALCSRLGVDEPALARAFLDLVCVGTVADVAPLVDENRALCATGLRLLPGTKKVGLRALLDLCDLGGELSASDVAFRLAPRLNAVGRMGDAHEALELLLTEDQEEALRLAVVLDAHNRSRQTEQERIYQQAKRQAERLLAEDDCPALVLSGENWHLGVVGIVASKIVEDYGRPAVVICEGDDLCRGSGRSLEGFNMAAAFAQCGDILVRSGGHALAGGVTLAREYIPQLREALCAQARDALREAGGQPPLQVDCEVQPEEITPALAQALTLLEPCGAENPSAVLLTRGLEILSARTVGREGKHLKLSVASGRRAFDVIAFGWGRDLAHLSPGTLVDLAYTPELNEFNGNVGLQLRLTAWRPTTG